MAADDPPPLDAVALLGRMADLMEALGAGEPGLPGLQLTADLARSATGAVGASIVEYTRAGGRVVAATGPFNWLLGRPVDDRDPMVAKLLAGPPVTQVGLDELPAMLSRQLHADGARRMLIGVGAIDGSTVASVQVYLPDGDGVADAYQLAAVRLLAAWTAHLYRESAGLPVYPDDEPGPEIVEPDPRDQARDLFIAVTSHELRTPVTVIKGYADTLVERWDSLTDPARREAVFVLWQRARELARLVDRLLTAASDVTGLMGGPGAVTFDPAQALRAAAGELTGELRKALRITLPATLPKVRGDRAGLATVLTELVRNGCKYSPEWVDVELTAGADEQTVWFRVTRPWPGHPAGARRARVRAFLAVGDRRPAAVRRGRTRAVPRAQDRRAAKRVGHPPSAAGWRYRRRGETAQSGREPGGG